MAAGDIYMCTVELAAASGIASDNVVNTFHVADLGTGGTFPDIVARVWDFYTATTGGNTFTMASHISAAMSRATNAVKLAVYALPATPGPTGPPVYVELETLPAAQSATGLPDEVCLVISSHGDLDGTDADRRKRGRLYLGPLDTNGTNQGTFPIRPGDLFRSDATKAIKQMAANLAADGWQWVVFSRMNWAGYGVVGGWVDNAFDTQRRRGPDPTVKDFYTIP